MPARHMLVALAASAWAGTAHGACVSDSDCGAEAFCRHEMAPAPTPEPKELPAGCGTAVQLWGNCHGKVECCAAGAECNVQSQWYAQCVPAKAAVPSPTQAEETCPLPNGQRVGNYGACTGAKAGCCAEGLVCEVRSQWYSQCVKAPATASPPALPACGHFVRVWGNCHQQEHCCEGGSRCKVQDEWYAQCVPAETPSPPAPVVCTSRVQAWGRCAGSKATCCAEGTWCDPAYTMCRPGTAPATAAPAVRLCRSLVNPGERCEAEPGCCAFGTTCAREGAIARCISAPGAVPCSEAKQCVPRAKEGEACGGFGMPCQESKCASGLVCSADASGAAGVCVQA